jgi:hypothetical protein
MKNFYIAASKEENGKKYAYMIKAGENTNIVKLLAFHGVNIAQICKTKKEAVRIVNAWRAAYIANGVYMFDE